MPNASGLQFNPTPARDLSSAPKLRHELKVQYPEVMYRSGLEGAVEVVAAVSRDGSVVDARVTKSWCQEADDRVLRAVLLSNWVPGRARGVAVDAIVKFEYQFRLEFLPSARFSIE